MKIKLYNRDRESVWLEKVGDEGWWQLRMTNPTLFSYTRLILGDGDIIEAVDPPGGPFLGLGYKFESGNMVEEIKNTSLGIFIKLTNESP